jgi:hypothetical protein
MGVQDRGSLSFSPSLSPSLHLFLSLSLCLSLSPSLSLSLTLSLSPSLPPLTHSFSISCSLTLLLLTPPTSLRVGSRAPLLHHLLALDPTTLYLSPPPTPCIESAPYGSHPEGGCKPAALSLWVWVCVGLRPNLPLIPFRLPAFSLGSPVIVLGRREPGSWPGRWRR